VRAGNTVEVIPATHWRAALAESVAAGWDYLEFLTAVDWPADSAIEVLACLRRRGADPGARLLGTRIDRDDPVVDSAVPVLPGASWYEREAHEMFGVRFAGNDDLAPLLLDRVGDWPARRTTPLPARRVTRWPGLFDPADNPPPGQPPARRRTMTTIPGNSPEWLS
jgi:NADH-quinone oxidoreductase subunit C